MERKATITIEMTSGNNTGEVEVDDIESILDELRAARDDDRDADVDEDAAFRAVYGRDPDADDRKDDIWSLIYAGLDA